MGYYSTSFQKQDTNMRIIALFLAFAVQDCFASQAVPFFLGGVFVSPIIAVAIAKSRDLPNLNDAAIMAMEAVCQCEAPIPQYINALYTSGQSCMNIDGDIYDEAQCLAIELGLLIMANSLKLLLLNCSLLLMVALKQWIMQLTLVTAMLLIMLRMWLWLQILLVLAWNMLLLICVVSTFLIPFKSAVVKGTI